MSSLARLRAAGIDAEASTHYPSMSRPNYVSIIAGVPPLWSGVRNNDYDQAVPLDSVLERARVAKLGVTFVSQVASGPRVMFGAHVDRTPIIPRASELESAVVTSLASEDDLVVVLLGAVDIAGHAHGADSPAYAEAVAGVDAMLARVLRHVDLARETVLVVADHGHIDSGGHGGIEPEGPRCSYSPRSSSSHPGRLDGSW
ncbi:MAG: alkaline phosphatase family protein [Myxococcota bacterium]|nr:alkaline phosphatase family protein [Myxococcota bacterium]